MSLRSCVGDLYAHVILEVGGIAKGYKVVNPSHQPAISSFYPTWHILQRYNGDTQRALYSRLSPLFPLYTSQHRYSCWSSASVFLEEEKEMSASRVSRTEVSQPSETSTAVVEREREIWSCYQALSNGGTKYPFTCTVSSSPTAQSSLFLHRSQKTKLLSKIHLVVKLYDHFTAKSGPGYQISSLLCPFSV